MQCSFFTLSTVADDEESDGPSKHMLHEINEEADDEDEAQFSLEA